MQEIDIGEYSEKMLEITKGVIERGADRRKYFLDSIKEISERQFLILFSIKYSDNNTVNAIAGSMGLDKSTISLIVTKLVNKGYITKRKEDADGRVTYLSLTNKGDNLLEKINKEGIRVFSSIFNEFPTERKTNFIDAMDILENMEDFSYSKFSKSINKIDEEGKYGNKFFIFMKFFLDDAFKFIKLDAFTKELTINQSKILGYIFEKGEKSVSEIAEFANTGSSSASICLSRLEKMGYIAKVRDKNFSDGRSVKIYLTEKGRNIFIKAKKETKVFFNKKLQSLTEENNNKLKTVIDLLFNVFNQEENII